MLSVKNILHPVHALKTTAIYSAPCSCPYNNSNTFCPLFTPLQQQQYILHPVHALTTTEIYSAPCSCPSTTAIYYSANCSCPCNNSNIFCTLFMPFNNSNSEVVK